MQRVSVLIAEYKFGVRLADGFVIPARCRCFDDSLVNFDAPSRLVLEYGDREIQAAAADFFAALDEVRRTLEPCGIFPRVNGVGLWRYPSGMARDMGQGLSVYRLRPGKRMTNADLVRTFDDDDLAEPATVDAQRASFDAWLQSFRT